MFVSSREEYALLHKFHCFTSTKVQILTQKAAESLTVRAVLRQYVYELLYTCARADVEEDTPRQAAYTRCVRPITITFSGHTR